MDFCWKKLAILGHRVFILLHVSDDNGNFIESAEIYFLSHHETSMVSFCYY